MRSRNVVLTSAGLSSRDLEEASRSEGREPDLALAFLSEQGDLDRDLDALATAWPGSLRIGCETSGQLADGASTSAGCVQGFWFERPKPFEVRLLEGSFEHPPAEAEIADFAGRLAGADGVLLFGDALRFPAERVLSEIGPRLPPTAQIAGGLGHRVFLDRQVYPAAFLALLLRGIEMQVEVLRGWTPASPIYTVTRAEGTVLHEIEGEPATEWYARIFTVRGEIAPLPEASQGFPLIIVGPSSRRRGLFRGLRAFDRATGTVTLWGTIETGDQVRIGMFDGGEATARFETLEAAAGRMRVAGAPVEAAILYSCIDRQGTLGERLGEEIASLHRAIGEVPLSGFCTLGEIGPSGDADPVYHNHAAVLALLRERAR